MLLYDLVERCNYRNENLDAHEQCQDCEYGCDCPHDCTVCLGYVHYPQRAPKKRKYDCVHMADCYYCKYAFKYASEIVYGLRQLADLRSKKTLRVMSIGCGPCTELAAIDYLRGTQELNYDRLDFRGIDPLNQMWKYIWEDIEEFYGDEVHFFDWNILDAIDIIVQKNWIPDIIIFQYVFSDMYKNNTQEEIVDFIEKLAKFINNQKQKKIYIFVNDINLSTDYKGGREFFDILCNKIASPKIIRRLHFNNSNAERHYDYGVEYETNELVFGIPSQEIYEKYNPFDSCASAQILIKKEVEG